MANDMMVKELDQVVVRFSGDSGDGMQLAGNIFQQYRLRWEMTSVLSPTIRRYPRPARFSDRRIRFPGTHRRQQSIHPG